MTEPSRSTNDPSHPSEAPHRSAEGLSIHRPPFDTTGASADRPRIGGLVLAAGTSSRFGDRNKLLATHNGEPIVRTATRTLLATDLDPILVVVGHEADRVEAAVSDLPVVIVHNPAYASGQASSVRTGIETLRSAASIDGVLVALGDMPFVTPGTIETLLAAYGSGIGDALAAAHDGERGNPVLFDERFFDDLTDVDGDIGGREILLEEPSSGLIEVGDPGVRRDIDEPSDLGDNDASSPLDGDDASTSFGRSER